MAEKSKLSTGKSLPERALARLARRYKLKAPLLVGHSKATRPETGELIHRFVAVSSADANGPPFGIITDQKGKTLTDTPELDALFDLAKGVADPIRVEGLPPTRAGAVTIDPTQNILTLNPGDTFEETITVTVPKNSSAPKADVYFLADTTGSMGGILNAVQTGGNNILTALSGLGVDLAFGVGSYKDFPDDPYAFQHQLSPTVLAGDVKAAINAWVALGGSDGPEGQLFALDSLAVPPGASMGWRAGSKRIVVWFGDMPGHDPICFAVSGAPAAITEGSVTAKLTGEAITVLAISTATPGLDGDPKMGASDYTACGPPGGTPGQGTRFATATGGTFVTGINPENIVNTIIGLVSAAVASINNVKLIPSTDITSFVVSVAPPGGYGPLADDKNHALPFEVKFVGKIPCKEDMQVFGGSLAVVVDGVVVGAKRVQITVPPCKPKAFVYSAKFVCGTQIDCPCECLPVRPGHYATEINIHNYSAKEVKIRKRAVPVVLGGAPMAREPVSRGSHSEDSIKLPPHSATMDDCCQLAELLFGAQQSHALNIGFLEITASDEVAVTVLYTSSGLDLGGLSVDVHQVRSRRH